MCYIFVELFCFRPFTLTSCHFRSSYLRRICPGRFLADEVLFTTIAKVLAVFDIAPARNEDTNEPIIPSEACTDGGIT